MGRRPFDDPEGSARVARVRYTLLASPKPMSNRNPVDATGDGNQPNPSHHDRRDSTPELSALLAGRFEAPKSRNKATEPRVKSVHYWSQCDQHQTYEQ